MAKYHGLIGYVISKETSPGVWTDQVKEANYVGDTIQNNMSWNGSQDTINDNMNIRNKISIVADKFASMNFQHIKYATYMGTKWKVISVEVNYPRLILTLGGVYNGQ